MRKNEQLVYTTKTGMPQGEKIVHALLILCTFGLWYPMYRSRLRYHRENARTYTS